MRGNSNVKAQNLSRSGGMPNRVQSPEFSRQLSVVSYQPFPTHWPGWRLTTGDWQLMVNIGIWILDFDLF